MLNKEDSKIPINCTFQVMFFVLLYFISLIDLSAQSNSSKYQLPPKVIAGLVDAPPTPSVILDPTRKWMLLQEYPNLISIDELAQPELRLAGIRMNPQNHGPSRNRYVTGLKLLEINTGKEFEIEGIPKPAKLRNI